MFMQNKEVLKKENTVLANPMPIFNKSMRVILVEIK